MSSNSRSADNVFLDEKNSESQPKTVSFRAKSNKKEDDFNFTENLQKLGLDDSKSSGQNLTNVQGSYLSYLLLRHLRIRDLKRQVILKLVKWKDLKHTIAIEFLQGA